jgi:hypothetical protein
MNLDSIIIDTVSNQTNILAIHQQKYTPNDKVINPPLAQTI